MTSCLYEAKPNIGETTSSLYKGTPSRCKVATIPCKATPVISRSFCLSSTTATTIAELQSICRYSSQVKSWYFSRRKSKCFIADTKTTVSNNDSIVSAYIDGEMNPHTRQKALDIEDAVNSHESLESLNVEKTVSEVDGKNNEIEKLEDEKKQKSTSNDASQLKDLKTEVKNENIETKKIEEANIISKGESFFILTFPLR